MSAFRRLASGNIATLSAMMLNIVAQVTLVPVYLHFWPAERYGVWLVLNTSQTLLVLIDTAHQDFIGFESMKIVREDRAARSQLLSDCLPVIAIVGAVELLLVGLLLASPFAGSVFGVASAAVTARDFSIALFCQILIWVAYQNLNGILVRLLGSLGYYSTGAWWGVATGMATAIAPAVAASLGAGIKGAAFAQIGAIFVVDTLIYRSYFGILRREGIAIRAPDLRAGFRRYRLALGLSVATGLEFLQQTGFRLVLLPLLGPVRLVQFTTLRTVANVAQQGLGTLINPTVPELMRFVSARNAAKTAAVMAGMIYLSVIFICPAFVFLQLVVARLYGIWTLGKVPFDGYVFALLSGAVMVYGLSQSCRAIVRGNNLVFAQTLVSFLAGLALVAVAFFGTGRFGLLAAACALLSAELIRSGLNMRIATRWLSAEGLASPAAVLRSAGVFVAFSLAVVLLMTAFPAAKLLIAALYVPAWGGMNLLFWRTVPADARELITRSLQRFVPRRLALRLGHS